MINFMPLFLIAFHPVNLVSFGKNQAKHDFLFFLQDISKTFDTNGDVYAVYLDF